ncbi:MAG: RNA polymerase sigma factor [Bryobacteraceae bacterium]
MPIDLVPELADACETPERSAVTRHQKEPVFEALKTLSPKEHQAIVLRDLEGYSTAEVAHMLGSGEATVRSQIWTGRVEIKDFLHSKLGRRL